MKSYVGARLALACSLAVHGACSALVGADFTDVHARAASDGGGDAAPDAGDVSDARDADLTVPADVESPTDLAIHEATDVSDTPIDVETADAADASAGGDVADAADAPHDADATDAIVCGATRCNGSCVSGRCLETLVTGQIGVSGIAADDAYVYWSNFDTGAVMRAPLGAGALSAQPTFLASDTKYGPEGTAVVGGTIYWANWGEGSLQSTSAVPAPGNPAASTPLINGQTQPTAITTDAAFIYWANFNGDDSILVAPLGGPSGDAAAVVLVQGDAGHPNCLAVDSTQVYWADNDGTLKAASLEATIDDIQSTTIFSIAPGSHGLAVDDTYLYWADPDVADNFPNGKIWRLRWDKLAPQATPEMIVSGQGNPNALFVDANYVYWGNIDTGEIMRTAKD